MATKTHYKVAQKIEAFYAGGAVSFARSGELIACAYYDEVKVSLRASDPLYFQMMQRIAGISEAPDTAGRSVYYWVRVKYFLRSKASATANDR